MVHKDNNAKNSKDITEPAKTPAAPKGMTVGVISKPAGVFKATSRWVKNHKLMSLLLLLWVGLLASVGAAFIIGTDKTTEPLSEKEQYANTLNSITQKGVQDSASFEEKSDYYYDVLAFSNLSDNPRYVMSIYKNEVAGKGYDIDPYSLEWLYEEFMKVPDFQNAKQALKDAVALIEKNKAGSSEADLQEINAYQQTLQEKINKIQ